MDWKKLAEPFHEDFILWRLARTGMKDGKPWALAVAYVDARAAQDRLDEVVGPQNWRVSYRAQNIGKEAGFLASVGVRDGEIWIDKEDGAELTDIESFKGGISKAFIRAASAWGVGRYLYNLSENFVEILDNKPNHERYGYQKATDGGRPFYWAWPKLPAAFLPKPQEKAKPVAPPPAVQAPATAQPAADQSPAQAQAMGLAKLAHAMAAHKWTPASVNAYVKSQFQKASARELTAEELTAVMTVVQAMPYSEAITGGAARG